MSNINKISVNGTVYDIEDTTARASSGVGLTDDIKTALLNCFEKVAWIDADGQDYYDALESALYPPANLTSISCVYTQSGTVYDTDSLDSLKSDLVVTAHYDNSTTQTVNDYTLSGTLEVGTSTITVSYGGKTTTFNVTVTTVPVNPFDNVNWNDGLRLAGGTEYQSQNNYTTTDFVDVTGVSSVTLRNTKSSNMQYYICWYSSDNNSSYISSENGYLNADGTTYPATKTSNKPEGATHCRLCVTKVAYDYPYTNGALVITVG